MASNPETLVGKEARIGGNFRPQACDNEELTPQPSTSQPSWAD